MNLWDYAILVFEQFGGGPGPRENNFVRFGLAAILWGFLLVVTWKRQRESRAPRERLLVWGFAFGLFRELLMFAHTTSKILGVESEGSVFLAPETLEHGLTLIALSVIAAAYLRYLIQSKRLALNYLIAAGLIGVGGYAVTTWGWALALRADPGVHFHDAWAAWPFHIATSALLVAALLILRRERSWLCNVVSLALSFFLLGEAVVIFNLATGRIWAYLVCPIANVMHIAAIPLLGYVYLHEQTLEKQSAEAQLEAYRNHLEDLVRDRTAELATLTREHRLILESAGEGVLGVDVEGRHTFVNPAASRMLGYAPEGLIGQPSHATWHHTTADGRAYPESACPLHEGYKTGRVVKGEDQVFWRKDGTAFPVAYLSTPIVEDGLLHGAVIIFQDISQRKQAELEIRQRNNELAAQNAVAATLTRSLNLETMLNAALETTIDRLDLDGGAIFLYDERPGNLQLVAAHRGRHLCCSAALIASAPAWTEASAKALETWEPVVSPLGDSAGLGDGNACMLLSIPLVTQDQAKGALTVVAEASHHLVRDVAPLMAIGQQIGIAVDNARLYRETQQWAASLASLHDASVVLSVTLEERDLCEQIVFQGARLLEANAASLLLLDEHAESVVQAHFLGFDELSSGAWRNPEAQAWILDLIHNRRLWCGTASDETVPTAWKQVLGARSFLGMALWGESLPMGYLLLTRDGADGPCHSHEIKLAENFANIATVMLQKARLEASAQRAVVLEERQRIAGDVHDGLAQTLSYLSLQVDTLAEMAGAGDSSRARSKSDQLHEVIFRASQDVRQLISDLQTPVRRQPSLQELLRAICAEHAAGAHIAIVFATDVEDPIRLSTVQEEQVQRIVQEALFNARRHADARRIEVSLGVEDRHLIVEVRDDGRGFDLQNTAIAGGNHFGLSIMRARTARLGGRLEIDTAPGAGTRVMLRWPQGNA